MADNENKVFHFYYLI